MNSWQVKDEGSAVAARRPTGFYFRPAWTAELRRIEEMILSGVTWS
jgi:hypothetical protein